MAELIYAGSTSQTIDIFIADSSSAVGAGLAGLVFNTASLTCYRRIGATGASTIASLATQTVGGAWTSGGFVEIDATNQTGMYRWDIPDALLVSAGFVHITFQGAVNMAPTILRIDCRAPTVALLTATQASIDAIEADTNELQTDWVDGGRLDVILDGAGGGGGGGGSDTATFSGAALAEINAIKAKTDTIGTAAGATTLLAASVLVTGTITSFPSEIVIGDSYTTANGRAIQIPIVDTDGLSIASTGTLNFADANATFVIQRVGETDATRIITGTATFVDPPGTGTSDSETPYASIEMVANQTAKGLIGYKYSGVLTFTWPGTGSDDEVISFETATIQFDN